MTALGEVLSYHERTKHNYHQYAAGPGFLDWDTQPDPYRRFHGAPVVRLRIPPTDDTPVYPDIFFTGRVDARPLTLETLSDFLFYSLSISAWKQYGESRWSLRVNPSSGNLHPTEGYVVVPGLPALHALPSVHHYAPQEHGLERRSEFSGATWESLMEGLGPDAFLVGLSSIHWRESWKYGERAYRYCQHDVGHALAALRLSAAMLGWGLAVLDTLPDEHAALLLGLDRPDGFVPEERECPDLVAIVLPHGPGPQPEHRELSLPEEAVRVIAQGSWTGSANELSSGHQRWDAIEVVSKACTKIDPVTLPERSSIQTPRIVSASSVSRSAGAIVRQRRSAQSMDDTCSMPLSCFCAMLARVLPSSENIPWDATGAKGLVHLGIFVHRVEGLTPGLYALIRDPARVEYVRQQMNPAFAWIAPPGCSDGLPLFLLKEMDCRGLAAGVSCGQDIAGDSAFSLGMLAEFEPTLTLYGAHFYRNLFWETGMIGQVLYLEAEAWGLRATGIGCFFDDPVHEVFGIRDHSLQSLYHFTVGSAIEDTRIRTVSAYAHLE